MPHNPALPVRVTPDWVHAAVDRIRVIAGDDEAAHGEEDQLYRLVLGAIATRRCDNPKECARLALETANIEFARWCA